MVRAPTIVHNPYSCRLRYWSTLIGYRTLMPLLSTEAFADAANSMSGAGNEMRSALSSGDHPCGRNCPKKATYPALVLRDETHDIVVPTAVVAIASVHESASTR